LAHGVSWQAGNQSYFFGDLVISETVLECLRKAARVGLVTVARHDNSHYRLAEIRVRHADDSRLKHAGLFIEKKLDLLWIDVKAARNNHVLVAADNGDIIIRKAVAAQAADIA